MHPSLRLNIVSIRKSAHDSQTEPTYGHNPHNFITNVNQRILAYFEHSFNP